MKIQYDSVAYEMPWRQNYEKRACIAWGISIFIGLIVCLLSGMPQQPFFWMLGIAVIFLLVRFIPAIRLSKQHKALKGFEVEVISLDTAINIFKKYNQNSLLYLGRGYDWENRHAQKVFEILKLDWRTLFYKKTFLEKILTRKESKEKESNEIGANWIHGVELAEQELTQPFLHTEGHTLITGTTGAGKTRLFILLVAQYIFLGQSVIMIDPKGDKGLESAIKNLCNILGQPERYVYLHPAFPRESARIDPMKNFSRTTELASRIAELIPSESGSDAFKSFGWQALNNVINGLIIIGRRPTIKEIKKYLEGSTADLVIETIEHYAKKVSNNWEERIIPYSDAMAKANRKDKKAQIMVKFYESEIKPYYQNSDVDGLISMFIHDPTHFAKMIASLLPIMNMLTSGELGELLSPNTDDLDDQRPILDTRKIINNKQVAYIGLDSLTDSIVGSAIGSIFISDLTAVAGDRYNYEVNDDWVNIFIDEASEVITESLIQLLNKARGAKIRLFVATQTIADFAAKLRSKDQAMRVLGNINNLISLRVIDSETQKYVTDSMPLTRLKSIMRSQGQNTDGTHPVNHGGNIGERLVEEEKPLIESQLLGYLPNLEYFAKISGGRVIKGRLPVII